jgi:hypothetical protein
MGNLTLPGTGHKNHSQDLRLCLWVLSPQGSKPMSGACLQLAVHKNTTFWSDHSVVHSQVRPSWNRCKNITSPGISQGSCQKLFFL